MRFPHSGTKSTGNEEHEQVKRPSRRITRPTRDEKNEQVKRAAFIFARLTRDADAIAKALEVNPRTVYRMIERPDFNAELEALGYDGPRNFRTKPARRPHPNYERAEELWNSLSHLPRSRRGKIIAEELDIPIDRVWNWMRKWKETPKMQAVEIQRIIDVTKDNPQNLVIGLKRQTLVLGHGSRVEDLRVDAIETNALGDPVGTVRVGDRNMPVIYDSNKGVWRERKQLA